MGPTHPAPFPQTPRRHRINPPQHHCIWTQPARHRPHSCSHIQDSYVGAHCHSSSLRCFKVHCHRTYTTLRCVERGSDMLAVQVWWMRVTHSVCFTAFTACRWSPVLTHTDAIVAYALFFHFVWLFGILSHNNSKEGGISMATLGACGLDSQQWQSASYLESESSGIADTWIFPFI